jgi:hypothetical protein
MISVGSVSFYRPRDTGPYFGQEFDLFDGILEFVPLLLIKSFDVNQYAHAPALRLKPITPEKPNDGAGGDDLPPGMLFWLE